MKSMNGGGTMQKEDSQVALLKALNVHFNEKGETNVSSMVLHEDLSWDHNTVVGIMKSLEMMHKIRTEQTTHTVWSLTDEGKECLTQGTPEFRLLKELRDTGACPADELRKTKWKNLGLNTLLKNKWAVSTEGRVTLCQLADSIQSDPLEPVLSAVRDHGMSEVNLKEKNVTQEQLSTLSKRKLVTKTTTTVFLISPTETFSTEIQKQETDLTRAMLQSGSWKSATFKPYNFKAAGLVPKCGSVHPLMQTMNVFRNILVQMGFEEMPTQRWVESSFWNFDALFQPQTHPVRDAHDTFFMKTPATHPVPQEGDKSLLDYEYFQRVKAMHEHGDDESLGWRSQWKESEATKLIMRTHTTCISSQMLKKMGDEYKETGVFIPRKFFSIDRVFRNETLDATHLAEFHQVEGVVAERGASLASLMGITRSFFNKIGITELKFKPAYNPYTEPSMEIFGYHPVLKTWTEIGNTGVFRPEMLKPMGLPDDVVVLGWGLSLERPTMINRQVKDIRELFGPKAKLSVF